MSLRSLQLIKRMSSKIPEVDIDPSGVFKYILIKLDVQEDSDKITADVVRGYAECGYHGMYKTIQIFNITQ